MPDEPSRIAAAKAEATDKAEVAAELRAHEQRLIAINHSNEKTNAQLEIMLAKFEVIATMIVGLGHRQDVSDNRFKSAQETMEITARVLREKTQQDRENVNSSRAPWQFILLIVAGAVGLGSLLYTIFAK